MYDEIKVFEVCKTSEDLSTSHEEHLLFELPV